MPDVLNYRFNHDGSTEVSHPSMPEVWRPYVPGVDDPSLRILASRPVSYLGPLAHVSLTLTADPASNPKLSQTVSTRRGAIVSGPAVDGRIDLERGYLVHAGRVIDLTPRELALIEELRQGLRALDSYIERHADVLTDEAAGYSDPQT